MKYALYSSYLPTELSLGEAIRAYALRFLVLHLVVLLNLILLGLLFLSFRVGYWVLVPGLAIWIGSILILERRFFRDSKHSNSEDFSQVISEWSKIAGQHLKQDRVDPEMIREIGYIIVKQEYPRELPFYDLVFEAIKVRLESLLSNLRLDRRNQWTWGLQLGNLDALGSVQAVLFAHLLIDLIQAMEELDIPQTLGESVVELAKKPGLHQILLQRAVDRGIYPENAERMMNLLVAVSKYEREIKKEEREHNESNQSESV